jgi:hypothetical protein
MWPRLCLIQFDLKNLALLAFFGWKQNIIWNLRRGKSRRGFLMAWFGSMLQVIGSKTGPPKIHRGFGSN